MTKPYDNVKPSHYDDGSGKDLLALMSEEFGVGNAMVFCILNAMKYIRRAGKKPGADITEDLNKANEYLKRAIQFKDA
jgi:site-specific recombinase